MKLLILGGISEAKLIATQLSKQHDVIYAIKGDARRPGLPCQIHIGAFQDAQHLQAYLKAEHIEGLIDATHPYAAHISQHAVSAARQLNLPLWRYTRPAWPEKKKWIKVSGDDELLDALRDAKKVFFTIGRSAFRLLPQKPVEQNWLIRAYADLPANYPNVELLKQLGPFSLQDELNLMQAKNIDALVTKNSGGQAVEAKLQAAEKLGIKACILRRPVLPKVDREFNSIIDLLAEMAP